MPEPAPRPAGPGRRLGVALVTAQLGLLALLLALAAPALWQGLHQGRLPLPALLLLGLGTVLGLWALWANRPGNFNIRPDPREGAQLVVHGPYRWIRHPMYSALMLAGAGLVLLSGGFWAGVAWLALLAVLDRKARLEETLMAQAHPGYAAYAGQTRRFVPGVL